MMGVIRSIFSPKYGLHMDFKDSSPLSVEIGDGDALESNLIAWAGPQLRNQNEEPFRRVCLERLNFGRFFYLRELGVNRYLVDMRAARNIESPVSGYKCAYEDMQQTPGIDRNTRVAILVSPGDHSHDFIETVARNSGLHVTVFFDYEQAVLHLTDS